MEKGNELYHKLDKWIGIPLVQILRVFKGGRNSSIPSKINRVAILNLGSIGDNVLMSAIVSDLKAAYADAEITVFTGSSNYSIVKLIPAADRVIKLSITKLSESIRLIRSEGDFDIMIDFGPWPRINAIYSFFFRSGCKIGFRSKGHYRHYLYDHPVLHSDNDHELENFRRLVRPLIVPATWNVPELPVVTSDRTDRLISELGAYCVLHPWPGGYKSYMKEWPDLYWAEFIGMVQDRFDTLVISGAPSDKDKTNALMEIISHKPWHSKVRNLCGKLDLAEMTHLLSQSQLLVCVNTGIAHMAAALDKEQICLHGPTNIGRWAPYSNKAVSLMPEKGTFGYLNYGYEYYLAKGNCMENLTVESAVKALEELNINPMTM